MKLLENNIGLVLSSIEWPSTIENEKQSIQDYVNQVTEYFPDGVSATEVIENLPDELPYSIQLKTLIELAKQKLLTLGATDYKPSPMEVLKIYGNPKHTAEKTQFNMNELEVNNPNKAKEIFEKYKEDISYAIIEWKEEGNVYEDIINDMDIVEYVLSDVDLEEVEDLYLHDKIFAKQFDKLLKQQYDNIDIFNNGEQELDESKPCWKGYKQIGMKKKGKREVPNCVPIKENTPAYKGPEGYDDSCDCYLEDELNELEVNNPISIKDEILKYLKKALDKIDQFIENNPGHNKLSNLEYYQGVLHEIIYGLEDPELVLEAKYQGRTVQLNKPSKGDIKKFKVYVKNPKTGKVVKVNFGAKGMNIKKNNPKNKKAYCSRSKGIKGGGMDKTKANYWSRRAWKC